MGTARHEGVRQMRFEGLLDRQTRGEITQEEAATVLGVSVRTFQRWAERYEEDGADGLKDGRLNRPSPKRAPREELDWMLCLFRDKYSDFTVKHFHKQLVKRHSYYLGYTVTKLTLHAAGLVRPAKKRSAHRKKRPRRPVRGMMLHQDGSRHAWLEGQPQLDLIVTMDDATSAPAFGPRRFASVPLGRVGPARGPATTTAAAPCVRRTGHRGRPFARLPRRVPEPPSRPPQ